MNSTPGFSSGVNVPCLPVVTPWSEVRNYYLNHGLAAYAAHNKELDAKIHADIANGKIK